MKRRDCPDAVPARSVAGVCGTAHSSAAWAFALATSAAVIASLLVPPRPRLLWNGSPSAPPGLYRVEAPAALRHGDRVVAWAPPAARRLAALRGYLPATVPMVKSVAALPGDRVCARGSALSVNGRMVARKRRSDPHGRLLPQWSGCRSLRRGELLLLSGAQPNAFDGRYFGTSRARDIIGKAHLLWRS